MPTLNWIGKDKVVNHHLDVPFRVLEEQYTYGDNADGNMIIHGDNLDALKALLPQFEGRVKCIYIDPPYNTGNEGWVYNDNVNDPKIRKWLGEVVGREGEDLSRHDKWLCMMYPRLKLLQKLLAEDGVIFISIDDTEYANLKAICDEIFGLNCFVSNISWQRTYSTRNDSKGIVNEVEHILVYSKTPDWQPNKLPRTSEMDSRYKNPDNDILPWKNTDAFAPSAATHQGMVYAIQHPFTGLLLYPANGRCWPLGQEQMLEIMQGWCDYELRNLHDEAYRAVVCGVSEDEIRRDVPAIVLSEPVDVASVKAQAVYDRGQWPRFFFTRGGRGGIARKTYLEKVRGKLPTNFWSHTETGHTDEAKKEMLAIFDGRTTFDTPKPSRLIERILQVASGSDSIILDSFAGSGTTAHAILNTNKQDGGHRRFILVETEDYAENITAERVRRVINGYGEGNKAIAGTGGGFSFYELGAPLMIDGNLNPDVPETRIREYVYYTETKLPMPPVSEAEPHLLGVHNRAAYYFYYLPDAVTTLNEAFLRTIRTEADSYMIYADINALDEATMKRHHITFKKIPRDITLL